MEKFHCTYYIYPLISIESGIDFESCCLRNVTSSFWGRFSVEFGRAAIGSAFYLADGEHPQGAFRNDSFFSTAELPYMRDGVVTRLVVLLLHREGIGVLNLCESGSPRMCE